MEGLKRRVKDYLIRNIGETITLIHDISTLNDDLNYIYLYPMDDINDIFEGYSLQSILERIDYDNFNPMHEYFGFNNWGNIAGNIISYNELEAIELIEDEIDTIVDALFNILKNDGYEETKNNLYFSESLEEIFNNYYLEIDNKKAYCIQFEINQLPLNKDFSKNSMEIINNYKFITNEELINIYEEFKSQTERDMEY